MIYNFLHVFTADFMYCHTLSKPGVLFVVFDVSTGSTNLQLVTIIFKSNLIRTRALQR